MKQRIKVNGRIVSFKGLDGKVLTIAERLVEQGYNTREIGVIGSAFSWAGIRIPLVPSRKSLNGRMLVAEAFALREKRRMDAEYIR